MGFLSLLVVLAFIAWVIFAFNRLVRLKLPCCKATRDERSIRADERLAT